jgi:hypothetical protein
MSLTSKLAALKARSVEVTFKDTEAPNTSSDIMELFLANSGIKSETANMWTIDLLPDFIKPITFIMLLVRRITAISDARAHPKISAPTVIMYYVSLLYGYFLLADCKVRPTPSAHARLWKESSWRSEFLEFLADLPVPEELETILKQYAPFETERSKNIFFVPSAAAFNLKHYFNRFLPLNLFGVLHDAACTLPGNSTRVNVMSHVLSQVLFTQINPATAREYCVANFLGYSLLDNNHAEYINSKFHQVFTSVFNPVLFRDYQRRSTLAEIGLSRPAFKSNDPNAYDILFSASAPNLAELKVVLQTVASLLKGNVNCKKITPRCPRRIIWFPSRRPWLLNLRPPRHDRPLR